MPRGVYTRRPRARTTAPKVEILEPATPPDHFTVEEIQETIESLIPIAEPETEAVTEETVEVIPPPPAQPSCALVKRMWRKKIPVWQCSACRIDTFDPALAKCPRGLPK